MKFTSKKKAEAIGQALRDIHVLTRAIKMRALIVKENLSMIADPEDAKSFKEMLHKCNYFTSRMDKLYATDDKSIRFMTEIRGESAIDELSLRVLDSVDEICKSFTCNTIKPPAESSLD